MQVKKPFGPTVAKTKIPDEIIYQLNKYVDEIVTDKEKSKIQNHGHNLIGDVTQEIKLSEEILSEIAQGGVKKFIFAGYATDPLNYKYIDNLVNVPFTYNAIIGFHTKAIKVSNDLIDMIATNEIDPKSYAPWFDLAQTRLQLGMTNEALENLVRALSIHKSSDTNTNNLQFIVGTMGTAKKIKEGMLSLYFFEYNNSENKIIVYLRIIFKKLSYED